LQANGPNSQEPAAGRGPAGGRLAALIYVGAAFVAALIFWLVTTLSGSYPAVARYGGAAWVFLLLLIVLMPIVIPRVNRWRRLRLGDEAGTAACPVPSSYPPSHDTSDAAGP
jgi:hypothetical protein